MHQRQHQRNDVSARQSRAQLALSVQASLACSVALFGMLGLSRLGTLAMMFARVCYCAGRAAGSMLRVLYFGFIFNLKIAEAHAMSIAFWAGCLMRLLRDEGGH
jgi:hypothetical protein